MHPVPTKEQNQMMGMIRDVLKKEVTPERLLEWEKAPGQALADLRAQVAELGWLGYCAPEHAGGAGAAFVDVALLYQECAQGLLPLQLINAMRGVQAVVDLDPACALLPELVRGEKVLALALDEEYVRDPALYEARVDGDKVFGKKAYVLNAQHADYFLVAARERDGLSAVIVEAAGLQSTALKGFADDSQAHVNFEGAAVVARLGAPGGAERALARMWLRQQLLALAEMVGGMQYALETTVAYVKEREQFGQVIALFQAVRHQAADMATSVTACRHLAYQAITRTDSDTVQATEVDSALAYVGQAFKRAVWCGHHLHGGAGYVVEHPMHWHGERAQSYCIRYTPEAPALKRIAAALLD